MSNIISGNVYNNDMVYTSVVFQQLQVRSLLLFCFFDFLNDSSH
jgi:hypothetical protein